MRNNFDLLRLVAALMVVVTHCYELSSNLGIEPLYFISGGILRLSTIGLYIFYFISGFLVTKSFERTKTITHFIYKRARRILPALIVAVIITALIIGPLFTTLPLLDYFKNANTWKYFITATGFFIQYQLPGVFNDTFHFDHGVNGSLWSIALELRLYLALIIICWFSQKIGKWFFFIPLFGSLIFSIFLKLDVFNLMPLFDELHSRLVFTFFIGSFLTTYPISLTPPTHSPAQRSDLSLSKYLLIKWPILLIFFCLYLLSFTYFQLARIIVEPLFFSYLSLYIAFSTKPQKLKIDISYGIYVYSFPITQCIIYTFKPQNPLMIICGVLFIVIPLSILSATLIEKRAKTQSLMVT